MNADDFRDYMLSFLFLRYLSDNYEAAAQKELGADYPRLAADDRRAPLAVWYADNADDVPAFEKQMRRKVHYVIHPDYLWRSLYERARTQDAELLQTLERGFGYIENQSFASSFQGLFSEINLNSEKLGRTGAPPPTATASSPPSSPRSAKASPSSPPTATSSATPTNTSSASSPPAPARRPASSTPRNRSRPSSRASSRSTAKTPPAARRPGSAACSTSPAAPARCS
jgi:hypothetical protein